jgi:hypothetical protein
MYIMYGATLYVQLLILPWDSYAMPLLLAEPFPVYAIQYNAIRKKNCSYSLQKVTETSSEYNRPSRLKGSLWFALHNSIFR